MSVDRSYVVVKARLAVFDRPDFSDARVQRELLAGDLVTGMTVATKDAHLGDFNWMQIRSHKDGYQGWVDQSCLGEVPVDASHHVTLREAPVLSRPDIKYGPTSAVLYFGSKVAISDRTEDGLWAEVEVEHGRPIGWVYNGHLQELDTRHTDPVSVARQFLGAPYVWGGNTSRGLDCSGLVQIALLACGIACPGDSGPQQAAFIEADRDGPFEPSELLFWRGHVAMATGPETMTHATAHAMSVIEEPIAPALLRIKAQGDAPWIGRGRPGR